MNAGALEQVATPRALYAHPKSPFVARFLGLRNVLEGTVTSDGRIKTAAGTLQSSYPLPPEGSAVSVLIRPELRRTEAESEEGNRIGGEVTAVLFRGRYTQVWLAVGGETLLFEPGDAGAGKPGDALTLTLAPEQVVPLPAG